MTDQERIQALEGLVAGMLVETNKVREHLQLLGGGALQLYAPGNLWGYAYVTGEQGPALAMNAYVAPNGTDWWRYDVSRIASLLVLNASGGLQFYTALPAANPIVWTTAGVTTGVTAPITNTGTGLLPVIGITASSGAARGTMSSADFTKLANATASRTATTLALRDASGDLLCSAWTGVGYSANWSDKAGYQAAQYRLGIDKTVHIRGVATKSIALVAGETIFTLPAGFRPPAQLSRPVASANGATPSLALCVILTNGTVTVYGGDKDHVSVDGLTFYLD